MVCSYCEEQIKIGDEVVWIDGDVYLMCCFENKWQKILSKYLSFRVDKASEGMVCSWYKEELWEGQPVVWINNDVYSDDAMWDDWLAILNKYIPVEKEEIRSINEYWMYED